MMNEIKEDCEQLLVHIQKCQTATEWDGYVDAGIIGYFAKLPFKKMYTKHFIQVESCIERLNSYLEGQGLKFRLDKFEEYDNEAILYQGEQLGALAHKQYQHRVTYFKKLALQVQQLLEHEDKQ